MPSPPNLAIDAIYKGDFDLLQAILSSISTPRADTPRIVDQGNTCNPQSNGGANDEAKRGSDAALSGGVDGANACCSKAEGDEGEESDEDGDAHNSSRIPLLHHCLSHRCAAAVDYRTQRRMLSFLVDQHHTCRQRYSYSRDVQSDGAVACHVGPSLPFPAAAVVNPFTGFTALHAAATVDRSASSDLMRILFTDLRKTYHSRASLSSSSSISSPPPPALFAIAGSMPHHNGMTPLHTSVIAHNPNAARFLLRKGALYGQAGDGNGFECGTNSDSESNDTCDCGVVTDCGGPPPLSATIDANARTSLHRLSALHMGIQLNTAEVVRALVSPARSAGRRSRLNRPEGVRASPSEDSTLPSIGIDLTSRDCRGWAPLHYAAAFDASFSYADAAAVQNSSSSPCSGEEVGTVAAVGDSPPSVLRILVDALRGRGLLAESLRMRTWRLSLPFEGGEVRDEDDGDFNNEKSSERLTPLELAKYLNQSEACIRFIETTTASANCENVLD